MQNTINWYPGHMKKATDNLLKSINNIDLIIEVVDARCIYASSNLELLNLFKGKKIIKVALKSDLCDLKQTDDAFLINTKEKKYKQLLIDYIYQQFTDKINSLKAKGLVNPQFSVLVVGLPNIGKSSLINFLSSKKSLIAQNKAGVTKKQVVRKINNNFYLIDTPGIFLKKINEMEVGYQLALINSINKNVLPITEVNEYYHQFMLKNYWNEYAKYFHLKNKISYQELINLIATTNQFKLKGNEIDVDKIEQYLFNIYVNSLICKYHF